MTTQRRSLAQNSTFAVELTFLEHLQELQRRITFVAIAVLGAGGVAFALRDFVIAALLQPLHGEQLVYLTPLSGVNFLIKLSLYIGILAAIPVIVYQLYKFLEPTSAHPVRKLTLFVCSSVFLAFAGVAFAYFVGLPAALQFLTNIGISDINAMITAESYLSFVTGYAFASALLFQIPLVMALINTLRPTPPSQLLKFERHVVVATLILAAVVSPTPDVAGQLLIAAPIFIMWHLGLLIMWRQQVRRCKQEAADVARVARQNQTHPEYTPHVRQAIIPTASKPPVIQVQRAQQQRASVSTTRIAPVIDMVAVRPHQPAVPRRLSVAVSQPVAAPKRTTRTRSIDGIIRAPRLVQDISSK